MADLQLGEAASHPDLSYAHLYGTTELLHTPENAFEMGSDYFARHASAAFQPYPGSPFSFTRYVSDLLVRQSHVMGRFSRTLPSCVCACVLLIFSEPDAPPFFGGCRGCSISQTPRPLRGGIEI